MTFQCRRVLSELKKLSGNTDALLSFVGGSNQICRLDDYDKIYDYTIYSDEISSIIDCLIKEGYLVNGFNQYNFSLTHKALHGAQYNMEMFTSYLLNNWIAIVALIISIIALLKP